MLCHRGAGYQCQWWVGSVTLQNPAAMGADGCSMSTITDQASPGTLQGHKSVCGHTEPQNAVVLPQKTSSHSFSKRQPSLVLCGTLLSVN